MNLNVSANQISQFREPITFDKWLTFVAFKISLYDILNNNLWKRRLRSSKSSVQTTAAGHVGQNSSAHVARSVAAVWPLLLFKWSQFNSLQLLECDIKNCILLQFNISKEYISATNISEWNFQVNLKCYQKVTRRHLVANFKLFFAFWSSVIKRMQPGCVKLLK